MNEELFQELLEKFQEFRELFQKLTSEERWALLYLFIVMAEDMDKTGKETV